MHTIYFCVNLGGVNFVVHDGEVDYFLLFSTKNRKYSESVFTYLLSVSSNPKINISERSTSYTLGDAVFLYLIMQRNSVSNCNIVLVIAMMSFIRSGHGPRARKTATIGAGSAQELINHHPPP